MKNSNYKQFTLQMNIDGHMLISESQIEYQDEVTSFIIAFAYDGKISNFNLRFSY